MGIITHIYFLIAFTRKKLNDSKNHVAKVSMYVCGCPNSNLILDCMIENPNKSVPINKTDGEILARL